MPTYKKNRNGSNSRSTGRSPSSKKKKRTSKSSLLAWAIATVVIFAVVFISLNQLMGDPFPIIPTWNELLSLDGELLSSQVAPTDGSAVKVHVIDVGQGDSLLIQTPSQNVLIDAGENNKGETVVEYLKSQGVTSLNLVIGTHPHSDHIGGLDYVIENMDVAQVLMPKIPDVIVPTTKTYEDVLNAVAAKELKITAAKPGQIFDLGSGAQLTILGPAGEFADLNNMSVVCRLDFGGNSMLFTGDCEEEGEQAILQSGAKVDTDILKAGHHGSSTSTSDDYLAAVSPRFAAISLGEGNKYGHPHKETMEKLQNINAQIYRTDLDGAIVFTLDGTDIVVTVQNQNAA